MNPLKAYSFFYLLVCLIIFGASKAHAVLPTPYVGTTTPSTITYNAPSSTTYTRTINAMPPGSGVSNAGGNYRLPNYVSTSLPNGTTINATLEREIAKATLSKRLVDAFKKGFNPTTAVVTVAGAYLLDKIIKEGIKWQQDTQEWLKQPMDDGTTYRRDNGWTPNGTALTLTEWVAYAKANVYTKFVNIAKNEDGSIVWLNGGNEYNSSFTIYLLYKYGKKDVPGEPVTDADLQNVADNVITKADNPENILRGLDDVSPAPMNPTDSIKLTPTSSKVTGNPTTTNSTTTKPDGTKVETTKTVTPVTNITNTTNNVVNYNTSNVTNITNKTIKPDGTTSEETTEEEEETEQPSDTPLPDKPKLYEPKYKDGIGGVWESSKPDIKQTAFVNGIKKMFPSLSGGSCPAMPRFNFNLGKMGNYGSGSPDVPCWIFEVIGLIMLTTAAFTARKILF